MASASTPLRVGLSNCAVCSCVAALLFSAAARAATDITPQLTANGGDNNITLAGGNYAVSTASGSPITYSGVLSGTGTLEVAGNGTIVLDNINTFTLPTVGETTSEVQYASNNKQFATYEGYTTQFSPALANGDNGGFNGPIFTLNYSHTTNQPDPPAVTIDAGADLQLGSNTDLHTGGQSTVILGNVINSTMQTDVMNLDNIADNGTLTFQGDGNFADTQIVGQISGTGAVVVQTGNMQLFNANTFSGPLLIENNMTLLLGSDHITASIPNASFVFNNGTLILDTPFNTPAASPMTVSQTIYETHFGNDINVNGFGGPVTLAGVYTYADNGTSNTNNPTGQLNPALTNANDNFNNALNVIDNRRGLNIGISAASGSTNPSGGIVQLGNGTTTSFFLPGNPLTTYISLEQNSILALDYSNSGPTYINTIIAGGPTGTSDVQESLATAGTGTVIFHQGHIVVTQQQYYDGVTQIDSAATLQLGDGTTGDTQKTGAGEISYQTSGGDGNLMQAGQSVSVTDTTGESGHSSTSVGTAANQIINNGAMVVYNVNATLLSNLSGSGTLTQAGAGTTTLGPGISYTGATRVAGGTLALASGASLAASSSVTITAAARSSLVAAPYSAANTSFVTVGPPVLDISQAGNQTLSNLAGDATGSIRLGNANLAITSSTSTTYGGQILDGGIAAGTGGSLTKQGAATLTLSNSNSYSGGTTISAGTLVVANNSGSATGSGAVNLNASALAGTGIITGPLSVAAGSHLSPGTPSGNSATSSALLGNAGTLTLAGGLTIGPDSDLDFDLAATPATGNDLIDTSDLSLQSASDSDTVSFNFTAGAPQLNQWYTLIAYAGDLTGNAASLQALDVPSGQTAAFRTTSPTAGALQVEFSVVPEPSALAGVFIGSILLHIPHRRRRDGRPPGDAE